MIVVLDVSGAIEIILQKDKKELFKSIYKDGTWIIAPDLFIINMRHKIAFFQTVEPGFCKSRALDTFEYDFFKFWYRCFQRVSCFMVLVY